MKVKEESEKAGLKLNIQKTKIMTASSITSWQIDGEKTETNTLFWGTPKSLQIVTIALKFKKMLASFKKSFKAYCKAEILLC